MDRTDRPKTGKLQWVGPLAVRASVQRCSGTKLLRGLWTVGVGYIPDGFITDLGQSDVLVHLCLHPQRWMRLLTISGVHETTGYSRTHLKSSRQAVSTRRHMYHHNVRQAFCNFTGSSSSTQQVVELMIISANPWSSL